MTWRSTRNAAANRCKLPAAIHPPDIAPVAGPLDCPRRVIRELVQLEDARRPGCMGFWGPGQVQETALLKRLEAAKPELLIAVGPEEVNRIFEYASALLAPFVLGQRAQTLEQAVRLLALNLDWYLAPPVPLVRNEWFWNLTMLACLGCGTVSIIVSMAGIYSIYAGPFAAICCLAAWPLWLFHHGDPRRALWVRTLLKHLRGVYGLPAGGGTSGEAGSAGAEAGLREDEYLEGMEQ